MDLKKSESEDVMVQITPDRLTLRGSSKLTCSHVEVSDSAL